MSELAAITNPAVESLEASSARIRARIAATAREDRTLRVMLVLAHQVLQQRAAAIRASTASGLAAVPAPRPPARVSGDDYTELVSHIRETVAQTVPAGARILVVSRGDDALLVPGFDAAHFPQGPNGVYAGHYPADSEAAVAHLAHCRAAGAEFLVLPATGYWWLDYYEGLSRHLLTAGRAVHHDEHCLIFDLRPGAEGEPSS